MQAAKLDLSATLKRMQDLKLVHKDIPAGSGYKSRLAVGIAMLKWAKQYKPSRPFTKPLPSPAKQAAQSASSQFVNRASSSVVATRELWRVVFEGVA